MGDKSPGHSFANQKRGDLMDGILFFEGLAQDPKNALTGRIAEFPADVQDTLSILAELYNWPAQAIPAKPYRTSKGGQYALWINELRAINGLIHGYGRQALEATLHPCKKLSISHPGAIMWCLPGEIGKLSRYDTRQEPPQEETTPAPVPVARRARALAAIQNALNQRSSSQ